MDHAERMWPLVTSPEVSSCTLACASAAVQATPIACIASPGSGAARKRAALPSTATTQAACRTPADGACSCSATAHAPSAFTASTLPAATFSSSTLATLPSRTSATGAYSFTATSQAGCPTSVS